MRSSTGIKVEVLDLKTNETIIYNSIRDTVKSLSTHLNTLFKMYNRIYTINILIHIY